jgi:phosphotransferase system enzyme I (PtsI)
LREAKALVRQAQEELSAEGAAFGKSVALGVMIEVPSAAIMADSLARESDFFSIGTNDLFQYTLGLDRNVRPPAGNDAFLPPSIIHLIENVASAGRQKRRPVGVCGELASQHWAIPLLVGLGVGELSMEASRIPAAREMVGALRFEECRALAEQALKLETTEETQALLSRPPASP